MPDKNPLLDKLISSLEDIQATDITVLDVMDQTTITDYMIICSGRSSRHVKSIAQQIIENMKVAGLPAISSTGLQSGDWALVDFGDFIVHIMQKDSRALYNLEDLWQSS
jgi:ribosome-associated protein